jgi:RNA polymerase sigma-70 factor (ECF subfamily)
MITEKDCQGKTDEELVGQVLIEPDYFLCLMKRYEIKLLRYIKRISNLRDEEVEDVLQDVFIKVYKNLNDFDSDLKFSSWIYRIAHNQVISNFRRNRSRPQAIWDEDDNILKNITEEFNIEKEIDLKILKNNINIILSQMDKKYREALVLKFLEEKDYQEISDILKKPIGTVGTLISRGKKQFLKILKDSILKKTLRD